MAGPQEHRAIFFRLFEGVNSGTYYQDQAIKCWIIFEQQRFKANFYAKLTILAKHPCKDILNEI